MLEVVTTKDRDGNIDPLATGIMEHYLSTMIDGVTGEGAVHGSFTIVLNDNAVEGVWEGSYDGYRSYVGYEYVDFDEGSPFSDGEYHIWTLPLKVEGHGKGGMIDKMQMYIKSTLTIFNDGINPDLPYPLPQFWWGQGTGFYK